jgi:hypothetical protein
VELRGVKFSGILMYDADWEEPAESYVKNLQKEINQTLLCKTNFVDLPMKLQ